MRIIAAILTLYLFIATTKAAEPVVGKPVPKTRWFVYIDKQTSNQVCITKLDSEIAIGESQQMGTLIDRQPAETAPRPDYIRRASVLASKLRDLFGARVSLIEIDLSKRKGISELGLSIESGKADDQANFEEFRKSLSKNEVIASISSGSRYANSNGKIDDACLHQLAKAYPDLRCLSLYRCPITGDAWQSIAKLKGLEELTLTGANLSSKSAQPLAVLKELTRLDLGESTLRAAGIEYAAKLPKLALLTYRIDDADAEWIGKMKHLTELHLNGSSLSDTGLKQLAGLTKLTILELKGTAITDAGLSALKGMTRLNGLNLDDTKVNGSGLGVLVEMPLEGYGLRMENTLLTGLNWMEHIPNFKSYEKGLMMITRKSKITPAEEAKIMKMLPAMSQAFLNH